MARNRPCTDSAPQAVCGPRLPDIDAPGARAESRLRNLDLAPYQLASNGAAPDDVDIAALHCRQCAALAPVAERKAMRRVTWWTSSACTTRSATVVPMARVPSPSTGNLKAGVTNMSPGPATKGRPNCVLSRLCGGCGYPIRDRLLISPLFLPTNAIGSCLMARFTISVSWPVS